MSISDSGHRPVRRMDNLTYRVAEEITRMILESGMHPADKLPPMAELEARYQVSHSIMREALRVLESRGLVQIEHGRGAFVSKAPAEALTISLGSVFRLQESTLAHLMELRSILEPEAAALAALRRQPEDLDEMAGCLAAMQLPPDSTDDHAKEDLGFHLALVRATHNPILINVMNSIQGLLVKSREITYRGPSEGGARALSRHRAVFEAVKLHDAMGVRATMVLHLQETLEDIELAIREGRLADRL